MSLQQEDLAKIGGLLRGEYGVDNVAFDGPGNMDEAPRYVMYLIFERPEPPNLKQDLYFKSKEWSDLL